MADETNFEALVDESETLIMRFVLSDSEISQDQLLTSLAPAAVLAHCNVTEEQALAQTFGLREESALAIFRQRIILYLETGFHSLDQVSYLMQQISMLDMNKIRQKLNKRGPHKRYTFAELVQSLVLS